MGEIRKRTQNPELLKVLLYRTDVYGDTILDKTVKKIEYTQEIATSFGFDSETAVAIVVMDDLAKLCYGETGEQFLMEIDPDFTLDEYTERLARKVFCGIDSHAVDKICKGIKNVTQKKHTTPEEQIAVLIQNGFTFADSLASRSLASLFVSNYRYAIIDRTAKNKVLSDYVIPENTWEKRGTITLSPEEKENRMIQLKAAHKYFVANFKEIPDHFKEGWGNISAELLAAYYVVGSDDKLLKKFAII